MSRTRMRLAALLTVATMAALPAAAENHLSGYLADFEGDFNFSSGRLVQLAEAIPADKYGWRPSEGVRSVSEVFIHVAGANYFFANQFGVGMPDGFGMDAEKKITAKDDVVAALKTSQEHVHQAIGNAAKLDLNEKVNMFGRERSKRSILMIVSAHSHEHLGQAIAYARSNGVVPPWSQPQPSGDGGGDGGDEDDDSDEGEDS